MKKKANDVVFGLLAIVNGIQIIALTVRNAKIREERKKDAKYWLRTRNNRDEIVGKWFVDGKIDQDMFGEYIDKRGLVDEDD